MGGLVGGLRNAPPGSRPGRGQAVQAAGHGPGPLGRGGRGEVRVVRPGPPGDPPDPRRRPGPARHAPAGRDPRPGQSRPPPTEVTEEEIPGALALMDTMTTDKLEGEEFTDRYTEAIAQII
ncbi:hypothetical protein LT493_26995 [Streptomyces tricolor]|nr:hypothetical protein [Streptomyces tricolor]